jgi:N-methylhydantoinase A
VGLAIAALNNEKELDMSPFRLGVDIGGTFTDLVLIDESTGELRRVKMSSTPHDPSIGFMDVTERIFKESKVPPSKISYLIHGTTVATNAIIEGKGSKTALVTTEGFRDVLEIARQIRPKLYDIFCDKPLPLVPRHLCFEVPERLDFMGRVLEPLKEEAVRAVSREIEKEQVEAVVICLLHSYVNPEHEQRVGRIISEELPGIFVSLSSDVCPEMREYYRASTTTINSLLMPVVTRYLEKLENRLSDIGVHVALHLMTSSGGIMSSRVARREPVHLIESGPAAGVIAVTYLSSLLGIKNVISFDMGGTTAKACLIEGGVPKIAPHFEVGSAAVADNTGAGYPVRTPVVDLVEIGAGGGSIAWIDPGGALRVGPKSAGADPGPACYGRGGQDPTVTDANLLMGRISPKYFLGGEFELYPDLAERAVKRLAQKLNMGLMETVNGIIQIANANMVGAIRLVSVQRGFDPRDFVLMAYGGAGPMHANGLARELSMPTVLIPMSPGVTSALGLLVSDIKHDYVRTYMRQTDKVDFQKLNQLYQQLETQASQVLSEEGVVGDDVRFLRFIDMRYVGQSYELKIDVPQGDLRIGDELNLNAAFFKAHEQAYGYADTTEPTEVVSLRLTAIGAIRRPELSQLEQGEQDSEDAVKGERDVYFSEVGKMVRCKVYSRYLLKGANKVVGPAIVEEIDSTVVIHPNYFADIDAYGNILIRENSNEKV